MSSGVKVGELYGELRLDKGGFDKDIDHAGNKFTTLAGIAVKAGAVAAAALIGVGAASAHAAIGFEKSMANVNTLIGPGSESEARIAALGADVKQMSIDTGKSTGDLADGLYQVVSAFGDTAESSKLLEIAAKGSTAGLASTTDAVNLLSAVTKGYGDTSAAAVSKASDLAFQTVKLGQTTFPELAASMGKVIPLSATLKVSQEELFGAMATLTGVTGNTAEVSTQLRAVMTALVNANPKMVEALKSQGYASGGAAIEALGLAGTLDVLQTASGGSQLKLAQMLGSAEALNAVLALTGTQADNFALKTLAMGDAVGETDKAFQIQAETVDVAMQRVGAAINVVLINLGERFLPVIQGILDFVLANLPAFEAAFDQAFAAIGDAIALVSDSTSGFGSVLADLAPIVGEILGKLGELIPIVIDVATTVMDLATRVWENGLNKAVATGAELIGSVIDVIGGLATAILENEDIMAGLATAAELIGKMFGIVADVIGFTLDKLGELGDLIRGNEDAMSFLADVGNLIGDGFEYAFGWIGKVIDRIQEAIAVVEKLLGMMDQASETKGGGAPALNFQNTPGTAGIGAALGGAGTIWDILNNLPEFAGGGTVPGIGPQLAIVHGGEQVFDPSKGMPGGQQYLSFNPTFNVYGVNDPERLARDSVQAFRRELDRQGMTLG